jgi:hypothetical protein
LAGDSLRADWNFTSPVYPPHAARVKNNIRTGETVRAIRRPNGKIVAIAIDRTRSVTKVLCGTPVMHAVCEELGLTYTSGQAMNSRLGTASDVSLSRDVAQ